MITHAIDVIVSHKTKVREEPVPNSTVVLFDSPQAGDVSDALSFCLELLTCSPLSVALKDGPEVSELSSSDALDRQLDIASSLITAWIDLDSDGVLPLLMAQSLQHLLAEANKPTCSLFKRRGAVCLVAALATSSSTPDALLRVLRDSKSIVPLGNVLIELVAERAEDFSEEVCLLSDA